MQKIIRLILLLSVISVTASAQYRYKGRMYQGSRRNNTQQRIEPTRQRQVDYFKPSLKLSLGYGFPNLDKNEMLDFFNYYPGKATQQGTYIGSLDYQFSRTTSIGVQVNYGRITLPYYFANDINQAFTGRLENTAVMLNLTRYIAASKAVSPYLKTAVGINIPHSSYTDASGNTIAIPEDDNTLAYQASLGVQLNLSQHVALFAEAGYGKYIVAGGLAFKF